jgi:abequosyltransferase
LAKGLPLVTDPAELSATPLLTIAIPTYNRSGYLRVALDRVRAEVDSIGAHKVEVLVSDNCSPDDTKDVVREAQNAGLAVRYVRNAENLGWARNFAQCVDLAQGRYLLMSGDDDVIFEGTLVLLRPYLERSDYGVICLRPYGFDLDYRSEYPGGSGSIKSFTDAGRFLLAISQYFTLTSALIVNRECIAGVDSRAFVHTSLATFHLFLRAALVAPKNLYVGRYLIGSKRQNSFSYEYYKVFVDEFWTIVDAHVPYGLTPRTVRALETQRLFIYYPFYMFDLRSSGRGDRQSTYDAMRKRFGHRALFWFWVAPTLALPRPLAIGWGMITMAVGRTARGDFWRGVAFLRDRLLRRVRGPRTPSSDEK